MYWSPQSLKPQRQIDGATDWAIPHAYQLSTVSNWEQKHEMLWQNKGHQVD